MSRFWPRAEYAEDQRYAKSILTVHVLDRGSQAGAFAGMEIGTAIALYRRWQHNKTTASSPGAIPTTNLSQTMKRFLATPVPFMRTVTNSAGIGAITGVVLMAGMLPMYMRGKTHVEWQDRSWRLLSNEGQVEVDDWSSAGAVIGAGTSFAPRLNKSGLTVLNLVGRGGLGALAGVLGYMGWRYGVMGGKRRSDTSNANTDVASVPVLT